LGAPVAPPARARNLRLATPSRAPKAQPEPMLPLARPELDGEASARSAEQSRFIDVDIEPAPAAA
jgi:hypothetical protein